jgi:hypothetical protein
LNAVTLPYYVTTINSRIGIGIGIEKEEERKNVL